MKNIVLVGFMGTGKSAVGRLLARRLDRSFVDLDERIARRAGKSVAQLFAQEGEAGFRKREAQEVDWASRLENHVIATGGGVMLQEENVRRLKEKGILVCLSARPDIIIQRTLSTLPSRPLLKGQDLGSRVQDLLALRAPFYAKADLTVDTSERSVQEVAEEILEKLGNSETGKLGN